MEFGGTLPPPPPKKKPQNNNNKKNPDIKDALKKVKKALQEKQTSTGFFVGVYHSFKDMSSMTTVSGQTASQKLDQSEDRSKEKVSSMWTRV